MTDAPENPGSSTRPDLEGTGRPRWQWVVGIIGLIVALLIAITLFAGGGHSPRRHGVSTVNAVAEVVVDARW
jgi:hypothetical protein